MRKRRLLLVEDNEKILKGNKRLLEWEGYEVDAAKSLAQAREYFEKECPDAVILDIMLPDGNGLSYMKELRKSRNGGVPILLLTGLTGQEDIIRGLTEGGDDYLTKPYDFPILLARIEALLRRADRVPKMLQVGGLTLDMLSGAAFVQGRDILLTQKEFALLSLFVQNKGEVIDGEYLYEKVWKTPMAGDTQALKTTVARLRGKLKGRGFNIVSARGEGYCLEEE